MKQLKHYIAFIITSLLMIQCARKEAHNDIKGSIHKIDSLIQQSGRSDLGKNEKSQILDSARSKLKEVSRDTILLSQYLTLANSYEELQETKKYRSVVIQLFKESELQKNYTGIGYAAYYISDAYYNKSSYDTAYFYLSKAERAANLGKLSAISGYIILNKANILSFKKDFVGAEEKAIHALRIASLNHDARLEYDCYLTLGNALSGVNDNDKALSYYDKAFAKTALLNDDPQNPILKAQVYNAIAKLYQRKGRHATAITYLQKALSFGDFKIKDIKVYSYITNNLGYSKFKTADPSALTYFENVLHISDSIQNNPTIVAVKINLAEYYMAKNQKETALVYILDARKKAHANKIFEDELKALALLPEIDPVNSYTYNKEYINLNDSLQNVERATRNKFARIEFETEEIVHQKNAALADRKAISTQRWLILGFSVMSILLLFAFFYTNSVKAKNKQLLLVKAQQKSNEEIYQLMLDQQQKIEEGKQIEKKRMSQELHDGIMGRLTSIRLNLFVLSKKTDSETIAKCLAHINDIQNIEKEIRTIAHDLNKNLFSDNINFITIVRNLFTNISNYSGINFKMDVDESIDWLIINSNVKMQIYRILQESMQNIDKYANAKNVYINMLQTEKAITVSVSDDGDGFDLNKVKGGIGLQNMRERAEEIKGKVSIVSSPGAGTKINLTIPI